MEYLIIISCICYVLSTAGYMAYLYLQKEFLQKIACLLLFSGFIFHTLALSVEVFQSHQMPVRNLYETLSLTSWAIAAVFLIFKYKFNLKILGVYAAPLVALIMLIATQMPNNPGIEKNIFANFWLVVHVLTIFLANAAFALAFGIGILYLIQENSIKSKKYGFFFKRLPSLELLDSTGYACIISGFSLLTVGLVIGFVYAKSIWGKFWTWDPKEVWSGITWLLYAALLHERLAVGWRGRKSAIVAIIGFIIILFTFFGVNFLLKGHHGEFTSLYNY